VNELPSGTVTFLFTDLEGSTRLWEEYPDAMQGALARHDEVVRHGIDSHGGRVVKSTGDGFHAAFATAHEAIEAGVAVQVALAAELWAGTRPLLVRIGVHTGHAELRGGDYFGSALNRAARLMSVAHGGQVVVSGAAEELSRDALPSGVSLVDLGEHRLRDLSRAERVFQVRALGLPSEFPPLASLDAFPGNLPLQVTSFIGRERELARVADALHEARVVTLTGVGGVGKTRLALQVAAEVLPTFRDGAWLVELAPVRDGDGVAGALAAVFGITARAGMTLEETLVEFFRTKELLLVLDNCEHVLDAVAELIEDLVRSCRRLSVLATSREGLALDGERILAVPSLIAPDPSADAAVAVAAEAVQLFAERARAADDTFVLDESNLAPVVRVCRRLDGVPLAVELAAARLGVMSPGELASALDRRFDVLAGGRRGAVKRHQTLRATIDWSYDLLSTDEQRLLARLAVFAGGCTRDAGETICGLVPLVPRHVFSLLAELVGKSLVVAQREASDTRYRLLETIREYGEERLIELDEVELIRTAHAHYYCNLAEEVSAEMAGPRQIEGARRLNAEHDNILAAMQHALDTGDADLALQLLQKLPPPPSQIGNPIFLPVEPVLALPGVEDHALYPTAWGVAAILRAAHGDVQGARDACQEASAAAARLGSNPDGVVDFYVAQARAINALTLTGVADPEELQKAVVAARSTRRPDVLTSTLVAAALFATTAGDHDRAIALASEGLDVARQVGTPIYIMRNLAVLAAALAEHDPVRARTLLDEAIKLRDELGFEGYADSSQLTFNAAQLHDWPLVLAVAPAAIRTLHWAGQPVNLAAILNLVARALATTAPTAAAVLQGSARRLTQIAAPARVAAATDPASTRQPLRPAVTLVTQIRRDTTALLLETLGDHRLHDLRAHGESLDNDHAVAYALEAISRSTHPPAT
jgi:predicted ATPase/class 3 adenylate cyclase